MSLQEAQKIISHTVSFPHFQNVMTFFAHLDGTKTIDEESEKESLKDQKSESRSDEEDSQLEPLQKIKKMLSDKPEQIVSKFTIVPKSKF